MGKELTRLLHEALAATDESEQSVDLGTDALHAKYAQLRDILNRAAALSASDAEVDTRELLGISKWVSDWIPSLHDHLLSRLDRIEHALGKDREA